MTKAKSCLQLLAFTFALFAVAMSSVVYFFTNSDTVKHPGILILASLFILFSLKKYPSLHIFQKIITFYIIALIINQIWLESFRITMWTGSFKISYNLIILSVVAISFTISHLYQPVTHLSPIAEESFFLISWFVALIFIMCSMTLLAVLLYKFYGYGYEHDWTTLTCIGFYLLLFLFLWEQLSNVRLRQIMAILFIVLFIAREFHG